MAYGQNAPSCYPFNKAYVIPGSIHGMGYFGVAHKRT